MSTIDWARSPTLDLGAGADPRRLEATPDGQRQPRTKADDPHDLRAIASGALTTPSLVQSLAIDLLNPSAATTEQTHKLKRLVQCVAPIS